MRHFVFLLVAFATASGLCQAQEQNTVEARLREALRRLTARVQTAEAEAAYLKISQADFESKNKALSAQVEKLENELSTERSAAEKAASTARTKIAEHELALKRAGEALDKWKAGHQQVTELAKRAESARITLAGRVTSLDAQVADLTRKNIHLFKLGKQVLQRFEDFSYGGALAAREPFIGTLRVQLENEIQGYQDKLHDPQLKP
jgi:chromosome segregation ATPase